MARLIIREAADRDIDEIADYIARDNVEAARRFYDAVLNDMHLLSEWPGFGGIRYAENPRLNSLRSWPVRGYRKYLIFYLPLENGIEVIRILHGAQEVDRIIERGA